MVGKITRVADRTRPKLGYWVRFRRASDGDLIEGRVARYDGVNAILDNGSAFSFVAGDRLERHERRGAPMTPSEAPSTAEASAPASYWYLNVGAHLTWAAAVLFLSLKWVGVI